VKALEERLRNYAADLDQSIEMAGTGRDGRTPTTASSRPRALILVAAVAIVGAGIAGIAAINLPTTAQPSAEPSEASPTAAPTTTVQQPTARTVLSPPDLENGDNDLILKPATLGLAGAVVTADDIESVFVERSALWSSSSGTIVTVEEVSRAVAAQRLPPGALLVSPEVQFVDYLDGRVLVAVDVGDGLTHFWTASFAEPPDPSTSEAVTTNLVALTNDLDPEDWYAGSLVIGGAALDFQNGQDTALAFRSRIQEWAVGNQVVRVERRQNWASKGAAAAYGSGRPIEIMSEQGIAWTIYTGLDGEVSAGRSERGSVGGNDWIEVRLTSGQLELLEVLGSLEFQS